MNYWIFAIGMFILIIILMGVYYLYSILSAVPKNNKGGGGGNGSTCPPGSSNYKGQCWSDCPAGTLTNGVMCQTLGKSDATTITALPKPTYKYSLAYYRGGEYSSESENHTMNNPDSDSSSTPETNAWKSGTPPYGIKVFCTDPKATVIRNTKNITISSGPGMWSGIPRYVCQTLKSSSSCPTGYTQNGNECVSDCPSGYSYNTTMTECVQSPKSVSRVLV
ncbi:MAG: furin-like repeat-containing protein [Acidimicrobiales bacterium]